MASAPFPYQESVRPALHRAWMPVLFGLSLICFESTRTMGGAHTARWLGEIWPAILGQTDTPFFGEVHHALRKAGHFTGYGALSLLLRTAWSRSVRQYLRLRRLQVMFGASALAVSCVFLVGSLDEWHQSFVPGRTSTCVDVLIDSSGALVFNLAFWGVVWVVRNFERRERLERRSFGGFRDDQTAF